MNPIHRILVPVDLSDESPRALDVAVDLARASGARLDILHVLDGESHDPALQELSYLKQASAPLLRLMSRLQDVEADVVIAVGFPAEQILQYAGRTHPDMIVVSVAREAHVSFGEIGETTLQLLRQAPWPLLTVPSATTNTGQLHAEAYQPAAA